MEVIADRYLLGNRFWPELMNQLEKAEIYPPKYNRALNKTLSIAKNKEYSVPMISELPIVFNLLQASPADIFDAIGRHDYLLEGTENVIKLFAQMNTKNLMLLTETAHTLLGDWVYEGGSNNPAARVLLYLDHHIFPKGPDDNKVYKLKLKYRKYGKRDIPDSEMPEWIIGNSKRLPYSTSNLDIEHILDTANYLGVSFRWLYNYDNNASFYGYDPDVEKLYDLWTMLTPDCQKMIINAAEAKRKEADA